MEENMVTFEWEKTLSPVYGEDMVTCVWEKTWSPVYGGRYGYLFMGEDMVTCVWERVTISSPMHR
jgi:hypothetical protein